MRHGELWLPACAESGGYPRFESGQAHIMDKKVMIISFILPALIALFAISQLLFVPKSGFGGMGDTLTLLIAIISSIIISIVLFFLRSRNLKWWQGILVSIGSVILAALGLTLFVFITDVLLGNR